MFSSWEFVKQTEVPEGGIQISGDPKAWPKWFFVLWRLQHKWVILEVKSSNQPYFVYFESVGFCMKYKLPINTKRIAVRIGRGDVRFAVRSDSSSNGSLGIKRFSDEMFSYHDIFVRTNKDFAHRAYVWGGHIADVTRI